MSYSQPSETRGQAKAGGDTNLSEGDGPQDFIGESDTEETRNAHPTGDGLRPSPDESRIVMLPVLA